MNGKYLSRKASAAIALIEKNQAEVPEKVSTHIFHSKVVDGVTTIIASTEVSLTTFPEFFKVVNFPSGKVYRKDGPSSRLRKNDIVESWTNNLGIVTRVLHRNRNGSVVRDEHYENGVLSRQVGPSIIDKGSAYHRMRSRNVLAFKTHHVDNKLKNRHGRPNQVTVFEDSVLFEFFDRESITLMIEDPSEILAEFESVDQDGNDVTDKFLPV